MHIVSEESSIIVADKIIPVRQSPQMSGGAYSSVEKLYGAPLFNSGVFQVATLYVLVGPGEEFPREDLSRYMENMFSRVRE